MSDEIKYCSMCGRSEEDAGMMKNEKKHKASSSLFDDSDPLHLDVDVKEIIPTKIEKHTKEEKKQTEKHELPVPPSEVKEETPKQKAESKEEKKPKSDPKEEKKSSQTEPKEEAPKKEEAVAADKPDFSKMTVAALKEYAKEHDIKLPSGARKAEIIETITNAE